MLVDADDLNYLAPWAAIAVHFILPMEQLLDAFRTGSGVPFEAYGSDLVHAIGAASRPQFVNLVGDWLASVAEIDARLPATPPARVTDVACGTAQSSIAIAHGLPGRVRRCHRRRRRIDLRRAGQDHHCRAHRPVSAVLRDASDPDLGGRYDLVTIFEALHD